MVETVGVGNHRCIGNCTLPVHDSFITHEFITSRLARNSWKAFSTKSDRCGEKKHGDDRSRMNIRLSFVHFSFSFRRCIEEAVFVFENQFQWLINISNRISFNIC